MKAGSELNSLVAQKVMGWCYKYFKTPYVVFGQPETNDRNWVPPFSTDIAAAFPLFEMLPTGYCLRWMKPGWIIEEPGPDYHTLTIAEAETAPLVICLAVLKRKGVTIDPYNESDTLP